ncbi:MAG TPA: hypothetical protein PLB10_02265 [Thiolinea sp.]|nr:hypothetical protein [Thiolinea sp.]
MSVQDAYAPPQSVVHDISGGSGVMTDSIIASLRRTRPWVLLLAILGFIGTAFIVLAAVSMLMGSTMFTGLEGMDGAGMMGGGVMIGVGVLYLVLAIIYFVASLYLLRYAGAIKRAVTGLSVTDLELALQHQAGFWRLMGILSLISIIAFIGMMVVGIGSAVYMNSPAM